MALGYEGYVKIGDKYALGTGTAVPRVRNRLDSSGGYGGQVSSPIGEIGIGSPRTYDWDTYDGSLSFEVTKDIFLLVKSWILARDTEKTILFSSRKDNEQSFDEAYWNSISISASDGSLVEGSLGFVALDRTNYAYGATGPNGFIDNKLGAELLCPLADGMPSPLNVGSLNLNPVPSWYTKITLGSKAYDFVSWTLDFSQDVVKFFACNNTVGPQGPAYMGVGPMTAVLSGAFMFADFPVDSIGSGSGLIAKVDVADSSMTFNKLELNTNSDDIQSLDSTVPVSIEYNIYELTAT